MDVPVRCPGCHAALDVPRDHLGREVECGVCRRPFVARIPESDEEPEVHRTTPILDENDDDFPAPRRRGRRHRPLSAKDVTSIGWGICSLVIGMLGVLPLPISLCCSVGVLGCIVSGIGLLCGLAGLFTNPVPENRGIAIAGTLLNLIVFIICAVLFFHVVVNK